MHEGAKTFEFAVATPSLRRHLLALPGTRIASEPWFGQAGQRLLWPGPSSSWPGRCRLAGHKLPLRKLR